jgi:putative redox protein
MMKSTVTWKEELAFEVEQDGHRFALDVSPELGGKDRGPRPKGLLLSALGGCTGVDVILILEKMKVSPSRFAVEVSAELTE